MDNFEKEYLKVISSKKVVKESSDALPVNAKNQNMKITEFINFLKKLEANCDLVDPQIRFVYWNENGERVPLFMNDDVSFYTNEDNGTIDVDISIK